MLKLIFFISSINNRLSPNDGYITLGIRIPQSRLKNDALQRNSPNWKTSIYDVYYLAACLRDIGMEATLPMPLARKTMFTDPVTGIKGSIGVDDCFIYDRDLLIAEYLKLDKRIRPLLTIILYFTKLKNINKCEYYREKKNDMILIFFKC